MLEELKKYKNFYYQIEVNFLNRNDLLHSYIIETGESNKESYEKVIIDLVKLIFSKNFSDYEDEEFKKICDLIDSDSFSDFQKVFPQNQIIKKEQLLQVKSNFKTKSLDNKQVYVVFEADKMNKETSNTILKFLEEPNDGVIAILVVKNRYMLLDTIISRCQVLTMDNKLKENINEDILVHFFEIFTSSKSAFLQYNKIIEELFFDKKQAIMILNLLEKKYYNFISNNSFISEQLVDSEIEKLSINKIIELIDIVRKEKMKLNYNVNFKLWLDNFIIKFMEVKENA